MRPIADALREAMAERGLSISRLAVLTGISWESIRTILLGARRPQRPTILRLVQVMPELDPYLEDAPDTRYGRTQLCWSCRKAVGGCSWSRYFEPVPGWTARPTLVDVSNGGVESFEITACPEFEED